MKARLIRLIQNSTLRLFAAALLFGVGVYLSFPQRGSLATLPLLYFFGLLAYVCRPSLVFCTLLPAAVAAFYGKMAVLPDFWLFGLYAGLSCLLAGVTVRGLRLAFLKKKKLWLLSLLCLLPAVLLSVTFWGTPTCYNEQYARLTSYFEETYPDQRVDGYSLYHRPFSSTYHAVVTYPVQDGKLDSVLTLTESGIEDGFRQDFARRHTEDYKADLIAALSDTAAESLYFDSLGFTDAGNQRVVYHGAFGTQREEYYPDAKFQATFRREFSNRREFARAVTDTLLLLQEKEILFGEILFLSMDGDVPQYRCPVQFSDPIEYEEILFRSEVAE